MSDTPGSSNIAQKGYKRLLPIGRTTRRSVLFADRAADAIIKVGGLLVILAVFGILAFLAKEAMPLFYGGSLQSQKSFVLPAKPEMIWSSADEYQTIGLRISSDELRSIPRYSRATRCLAV